MKHIAKKFSVPALILLFALGVFAWQMGSVVRAAVTYSWDSTFQEYWDVGFGCSSKTTCSFSCNSGTVGYTCTSDACTPYNTYVCDPWWSTNCGNSLHTEWQCTAHGMCTPDSSCAASTYVGNTCTDSCGNVYDGTKDHLCSDTGQQGTYPFCFTPSACSESNACGSANSGVTTDYYGTCSVSAPALPSYYGESCQTSGTNSCGMHGNGTKDCSNTCNAVVPPDSACGLKADLTVTQNNTPTAATVGIPVTFTGRVDNIGGITASPSFKSYFIVDGATNVWTAPAVTIPANSNLGVTAGTTYTFTSPGNHTVQLCADGAGVVDEGANEGNNCGPLTTVVVALGGGAAISSCTPSIPTASVGQNVTWTVTTSGFAPPPTSYSWTATGGTPGSASGGSNSFTSSFASAGSYSPSVSATNGSQSAGPQSCSPVTVSAGACNDSGPVKLTASATRVPYNTAVTLTVTGSNVSAACTLIGPGINTPVNPSACSITGSYPTPKLTTQSVYKLTCPGGQTSQVIVNVVPKIQET